MMMINQAIIAWLVINNNNNNNNNRLVIERDSKLTFESYLEECFYETV